MKRKKNSVKLIAGTNMLGDNIFFFSTRVCNLLKNKKRGWGLKDDSLQLAGFNTMSNMICFFFLRHFCLYFYQTDGK